MIPAVIAPSVRGIRAAYRYPSGTPKIFRMEGILPADGGPFGEWDGFMGMGGIGPEW